MNRIVDFDPKKLIKRFWVYLVFGAIFFTYSCKEDASLLGADLIPGDDKIGFFYDTTLTFSGYLLKKENYSTKNMSSVYLGDVNDPSFGKTSAYFASQYILTSTSVTFVDAEVDSVILYLKVDSIYGNFDTTKEIKVYEMSKILSSHIDSIYLTNTPITDYFESEGLISTSTTYQGDSLIKVNLTNTFGEFLIPPADSIYYYRTVSKFLEKYIGVAVLYDETDQEGGLVKISLASMESGINLYYKKPNLEGIIDTLIYSYKFNTGVKFNNIQHDFTSGLVNEFIENDSTISDSLLFVQGLGGITSKIVFDNYLDWTADNKYSILKAEMIMPIYHDVSSATFLPPSNLFFIYSDVDSNLYQIGDYSGKFFSGSYNAIKDAYIFDISRHLKNILNREIEDPALYIRIYNSSSYPNRVILKTGENIKLRVTYSKH